jgi:hypothetical protein
MAVTVRVNIDAASARAELSRLEARARQVTSGLAGLVGDRALPSGRPGITSFGAQTLVQRPGAGFVPASDFVGVERAVAIPASPILATALATGAVSHRMATGKSLPTPTKSIDIAPQVTHQVFEQLRAPNEYSMPVKVKGFRDPLTGLVRMSGLPWVGEGGTSGTIMRPLPRDYARNVYALAAREAGLTINTRPIGADPRPIGVSGGPWAIPPVGPVARTPAGGWTDAWRNLSLAKGLNRAAGAIRPIAGVFGIGAGIIGAAEAISSFARTREEMLQEQSEGRGQINSANVANRGIGNAAYSIVGKAEQLFAKASKSLGDIISPLSVGVYEILTKLGWSDPGLEPVVMRAVTDKINQVSGKLDKDRQQYIVDQEAWERGRKAALVAAEEYADQIAQSNVIRAFELGLGTGRGFDRKNQLKQQIDFALRVRYDRAYRKSNPMPNSEDYDGMKD